MKTITFLFPTLLGHLYPTISLSYYYQSQGFRVVYCGTNDLCNFTKKYNFDFFHLKSLPFAVGFDDVIHENQKEKWLESLVDRYTDKLYNIRLMDIKNVINVLNPSIIFLDEFNYSDFIILYPFLDRRRLIILQTKFPMYYNSLVPPLNSFAFPSENSEILWKKYFRKRRWSSFWNYVKFFGKDDMSLLKQKFRQQNIKNDFQINDRKAFKPTFKQVEEWFLVPEELDFKEQVLLPWQKYIGSVTNISRNEDLQQSYINFINKKENYKDSILIYCSLGTVSTAHLNHTKLNIKLFYNNLIEIANENPNIFFVIKKDMDLEIKKIPDNLLLMNYVPQIDILKKADIFLTHSGPGSVIESIICDTPMILFPLNDIWDQNGTAARMVYHNLGIKAELNYSKAKIFEAIEEILSESIYKRSIKYFSKIIRDKYEKNYLDYKLSTEL